MFIHDSKRSIFKVFLIDSLYIGHTIELYIRSYMLLTEDIQ